MVKINITAETNGFVLLEHGEVFIKNNNGKPPIKYPYKKESL